jgi:hypothetical protein
MQRLGAEGWSLEYRASVAQWKVDLLAQRPKTAKLVENERLRDYVEERLSGSVRDDVLHDRAQDSCRGSHDAGHPTFNRGNRASEDLTCVGAEQVGDDARQLGRLGQNSGRKEAVRDCWPVLTMASSEARPLVVASASATMTRTGSGVSPAAIPASSDMSVWRPVRSLTAMSTGPLSAAASSASTRMSPASVAIAARGFGAPAVVNTSSGAVR